MNPAFKPLLTSPASTNEERKPFVAKIIKQPASTEPFKPSTTAAHSDANSAAPTTVHQPKVALERQGNRISRIIVTCGCGEVIELDCRY